MEPLSEDQVSDAFEMRQREIDASDRAATIAYLVCEPLERAGFVNAFSTRLGGVSPFPTRALNLGYFRSDQKENVTENRRRFLKALDAEKSFVITAKQTHSTERCVIESAEEAREPQPECDAMITRLKHVLLGIQTADCLPVLIGDTRTGAMAAIHAGWRGTAGRIVERTIADMMLLQGVNARDCIAALGPAACVECYEVGEDVIESYKEGFGYWRKVLANFKPNGKAHLDIRAANVQQLSFCGFSEDRIHVADYCTMHQNELFFSYRKEGKGIPSSVGRLLSVIGNSNDQ